MKLDELLPYCARAVDGGATGAKPIAAETVVTAPWVRMKCRFGCPNYGKSHLCPPHTPSPEETGRMIASYSRGLLLHLEVPAGPDRRERTRRFLETAASMEGELFLDGYYRAFTFLEGPCILCKECSITKNQPCLFPMKARPSMEACGIDVYQTARNNDFTIEPLRRRDDTRNLFCLVVVD